MSKKQVWFSPNMDGGWRNHKDNPAGFPTKEEAMEGFNTLIGYAVGQGLKEGDYTTYGLCLRLPKYIDKLK